MEAPIPIATGRVKHLSHNGGTVDVAISSHTKHSIPTLVELWPDGFPYWLEQLKA